MTEQQWLSRRIIEDAQILAGLTWSPYMTDGDDLYAIRTVFPSGKSFGLHARDFTERGAYHYAGIQLQYENEALSWANLCFDRPDERARLALAAWKALPEPVQHAVPLADLSHYLDQFCTGLWQAARDAGMLYDSTGFSGGIQVQ